MADDALYDRHFSGWDTSFEVGTEAYYSKQSYTGGARCWNGPERSVHVCTP
jgi:protein kinase C substrate 80K-H